MKNKVLIGLGFVLVGVMAIFMGPSVHRARAAEEVRVEDKTTQKVIEYSGISELSNPTGVFTWVYTCTTRASHRDMVIYTHFGSDSDATGNYTSGDWSYSTSCRESSL